jgi:hypothetical protein
MHAVFNEANVNNENGGDGSGFGVYFHYREAPAGQDQLP